VIEKQDSRLPQSYMHLVWWIGSAIAQRTGQPHDNKPIRDWFEQHLAFTGQGPYQRRAISDNQRGSGDVNISLFLEISVNYSLILLS
jgi:hypothetical protein